MSTPNLLELKGVHTHIGAYHILHGVDLVVPRGQLTMLLGRNGVGKTTTLRTIMGLWPASKGRIRFNGQDITRLSTPQIACLNIAYVPENMGIFSDLTVRENMLLAARPPLTIVQGLCLPYPAFTSDLALAHASLREFHARGFDYENLLAGHGRPIVGGARAAVGELLDRL